MVATLKLKPKNKRAKHAKEWADDIIQAAMIVDASDEDAEMADSIEELDDEFRAIMAEAQKVERRKASLQLREYLRDYADEFGEGIDESKKAGKAHLAWIIDQMDDVLSAVNEAEKKKDAAEVMLAFAGRFCDQFDVDID